MKAIATLTLLDALRNRLLWLVVLIALLGFAFSLFMQGISIAESRQIQAGTLAMICRTGAVFTMCTFVVSGMLRECQDKGLEFFLALPLGRTSFFFGKLLGYTGCSLMLAMLFCTPLFRGNSPEAASMWGTSLFLELILMSSVSLFFSISLTQMPLALAAVAGFYLLSRSMGTIVLIMKGPLSGHGLLEATADQVISFVGFFMPRLDEFTQTAWLVYPGAQWRELFPIFFQTAVYLVLVSSAALYDFHRREI